MDANITCLLELPHKQKAVVPNDKLIYAMQLLILILSILFLFTTAFLGAFLGGFQGELS
jgi:hypothetical protein